MKEQTKKFKQFFSIGQEIFYAIHPDRKNIAFNFPPDQKHLVGKIQKLKVIWESSKSVGTDKTTFAKWPEAYFGDRLRGPFTTEKKCQEYLAKSMPIFDHEGHLTS